MFTTRSTSPPSNTGTTCSCHGVHPCILGFLILHREFLQSSLFCLLSVLYTVGFTLVDEGCGESSSEYSSLTVFRDFYDISPVFHRLLRHFRNLRLLQHSRFFVPHLYKSIRAFDYINIFFIIPSSMSSMEVLIFSFGCINLYNSISYNIDKIALFSNIE